MGRASFLVFFFLLNAGTPAHAGWGPFGRGAPPKLRAQITREDDQAAAVLGLTPKEWRGRLDLCERGLGALEAGEARLRVDQFIAGELLRKALDPAWAGGVANACGYYDHYVPADADELRRRIKRDLYATLHLEGLTPPPWTDLIAARDHFAAVARMPRALPWSRPPDWAKLNLIHLPSGVVTPEPVRAALEWRNLVRTKAGPALALLRSRLPVGKPSWLRDALLRELFEFDAWTNDLGESGPLFKAEAAFVKRVRDARSARLDAILTSLRLRYVYRPPSLREDRPHVATHVATTEWLNQKYYPKKSDDGWFLWRFTNLKTEFRRAARTWP